METFKVYFDSTEYIVSLPGRAKIKAMKQRIRKDDAINPYIGLDLERKPKIVTADVEKWQEQVDETNYWLYQQCEVSGLDPKAYTILAEKIGAKIRDYINRGPSETRMLTVDEAQTMIGRLMTSDGEPEEIVYEVNRLFTENVIPLLKQIKNSKPAKVAQEDLDRDPTQTGA